MVRSFTLAGIACITLLSTGCTGGLLVDAAGNPLANAAPSVSIRTCKGTFTTTASAGVFTFNPYDPYSSAFDNTKHVPEGMALVTLGGTHVYHLDHTFSDLCQIPWNNQPNANLPCSKDMFVYSNSTPNHPATGPNGEPIHDPALILGQCQWWDLDCKNTERIQRIAIEKFFSNKCALGNIK